MPNKASNNWEYLTEESIKNPPHVDRKQEMMYSTTRVRELFGLSSESVAEITGYRRAGQYSTQTMYYECDLVQYIISKYGEDHLNNKTDWGKEKSGVAEQERYLKQAKRDYREKKPFIAIPYRTLDSSATTMLSISYVLEAANRYCPKEVEKVYPCPKEALIKLICESDFTLEKEKDYQNARKAESDEEERLQREKEAKAREEAEIKRVEHLRMEAEKFGRILKQFDERTLENWENVITGVEMDKIMKDKKIFKPTKRKAEKVEILEAYLASTDTEKTKLVGIENNANQSYSSPTKLAKSAVIGSS